MNKSKLLFFSTITVFGLMFAIFAVMAQSADLPTFEIDNASATGGPVINSALVVSPTQVDQDGNVAYTVGVTDVSGVKTVTINLVNSLNSIVGKYILNDAGNSNDAKSGDGIYSGTFNIGKKSGGDYHIDVVMVDNLDHTNITPYNNALNIIGSVAPYICNSNTDCSTGEKCCSQSCYIDNCTNNSECVRCTNRDQVTGDCLTTESGTCDQTGCYNTCVYTGVSTCTVNTDCGASPLDFCNLLDGTCLTAECATATDCTAQAGGSCNTTTAPPTCEYAAADTTPPSVSITQPLDASVDPAQPFPAGTIIVKVTATDTESPIDRVEYQDESGNLRGVQNFQQTGYPNQYWQTITFTNGTHQVVATAYDTAGNTAQATVNLDFNIPSVGPIIDSFTTDKATYASTEAIQAAIIAHDDNTTFLTVEIFKSTGGGNIYANFVNGTTLNLTTGIGAASIVQVWAAAFDQYAVRQDNFKLPFIKIADAQSNSNCTTRTTGNNRYIYAMVMDDTGQSNQSNNVNLIINVTTVTCTNSNAAAAT